VQGETAIIIPLLNQRDEWLEQCVLSALGQNVPTEVIVVCSRRTSQANLRTLDKLNGPLRIYTQEREGFAAAINHGLREATSERIGLLLSDDWLKPDAVAKCLAQETDIVSTGFTCFASDGAAEFESLAHDPHRETFDSLPTLEEKAFYLTHFFLFRATKIAEAGGLDESIGDAPGIDDYDFIWTLLEHGATVAIVEERLYCYRDHTGERLTLRDPTEQARNLDRILAKHGVPHGGREAILRRHSDWFGKPLHKVAAV
jgi:glycosyltransferase involved in cell wall biosynthesis